MDASGFRDMDDEHAFNCLCKEYDMSPLQNYHEILFAMSIMRRYIPRIRGIVEIGSYEGANAALMSRMIEDGGKLVCIEPGGAFKEDVVRKLIAPVELILIKEYSTEPLVKNMVREALASTPVSVLFIDGDHTYDTAKSDYLAYMPLLSSPSIVAFHDIRLYCSRAYVDGVEGVGYYWDVIKKAGCYTEICAGNYINQFGIGLSFR